MAGKIVNSAELARIFGLQYQTIQTWISNGLPYVSKPEGKLLHGWEFDCGEVLKWRVEQARRDGKLTGSRMSDLDQAKARKMEADAQNAELNLALKLGKAVMIDAVTEVMGRHISGSRARLLSLPTKLGPLLAVEDTAAGCQRLLEDGVREALEELSGSGFDPAELQAELQDATASAEEFHNGSEREGDPAMGPSSEVDDLAMG